MKLKIVKIGESKGVIIPKSVSEGLNLEEGDYIDIEIGKQKKTLEGLKGVIEKINEKIEVIEKEIQNATTF